MICRTISIMDLVNETKTMTSSERRDHFSNHIYVLKQDIPINISKYCIKMNDDFICGFELIDDENVYKSELGPCLLVVGNKHKTVNTSNIGFKIYKRKFEDMHKGILDKLAASGMQYIIKGKDAFIVFSAGTTIKCTTLDLDKIAINHNNIHAEVILEDIQLTANDGIFEDF